MRSDNLFWKGLLTRYPRFKRQLTKLVNHTEFDHAEGNGYILRVTKKLTVYKRGLHYDVADLFNNSLVRNNALVKAEVKPGSLIFFYPTQLRFSQNTTIKLRSNSATIISIHDLDNPENKLGFAVSVHRKNLTGEQTAYIPNTTLQLRMRGFKDECGSGFHFYLFVGEVNRLWKN